MSSNPVIPWPGGKRRLLRHLLPLVPDHACYVEAFCGGAAMLFAKEPSKAEVINDVHSELVRLYRCLQHHFDEFIRQFRWALTSREMFEWAKAQPPQTLTDIQRATRFYYLQRLCFGAKVSGRTFGVSATGPARLNLVRLEEELSAAHLRLSRVVVEHLPWQDVMSRYDRATTFFFLDPPYFETEGYGCDFPLAEYEALAEAMVGLQGKALLTINDHPEMRRIFSRFRRQSVRIAYTIGGGKGKAAKELIYRTY